jgi:hypothetical protein
MKWGKSSVDVIQKRHYHFLGGGVDGVGVGGIIRQNSVVIRWLILCNPTKL